MKTFVFAPWLFTGHLFEHLAVARELASRGHRVYVAAEPSAAEHVRLAGCHHVPMPVGTAARDFMRCTTTAQAVRVLGGMAARVSVALVEFLRGGSFDAIVTDSLNLGAALAAERSGVPWVSLAAVPAESSRLLQREGAQAKIPTRTLRRRLGLAPTSKSSLGQSISPSLHLLPWTPDFDLGPLPRQARHVGPLNYEPPAKATPAWVRSLKRDRPIVLVTMTSSPFDVLKDAVDEYFRIAVTALRRMNVRGIITLSGAQGEVTPGKVGNVRLARFVPHSALMPHLDAAVVHGGWGIVSRSLQASVPLVVVPFGLDHGWNAQTVEAMRVGRHLPLEELSVESLQEKVEAMLSPRALERRRVARLGAKLSRWKPIATAANLVERV